MRREGDDRLLATVMAASGLLASTGCGHDDAAPTVDGSGVDSGTIVPTRDAGIMRAERDAGATMRVPPLTPSGVGSTAGSTVGCDPGLYTGSYACNEGFTGPVSFDLVTSTSQQGSACAGEFCMDLEISEASGKLRGNWIVVAFDGRLEGGLDCRTGEFRAQLVDGRAGFPDPNAPQGIIGLASFEGNLSGVHQVGPPQLITGEWTFKNSDSSCVGTFSLNRQSGADG